MAERKVDPEKQWQDQYELDQLECRLPLRAELAITGLGNAIKSNLQRSDKLSAKTRLLLVLQQVAAMCDMLVGFASVLPANAHGNARGVRDAVDEVLPLLQQHIETLMVEIDGLDMDQ
jgi:hypothetical protein